MILAKLTQRFKRRPLATALGLSLLVHLSLLWDGEFELPDLLADNTDEVLSKKKAESVPRVKLNIKPPARPKAQLGATIVTIVEEAPPAANKVAPKEQPKAPKKQLAKNPTKPKVEEPPILSGDPLPNSHSNNTVPENPQTDNQTQGTPDNAVPLGDTVPPPPEELAKTPPTPPVNEPPPSFPIEIMATYKASFMGFSGNIKQVWRMEGESYYIENEASKFGFSVKMVSEGSVSQSGIHPEHYKMYVNNKLRNFADIDRSTSSIRYGKNNDVKYSALQGEIQDAASLPFQVAVNFEAGKNNQMQVTTGSAIYNIDLKIIAQEDIKLPAGVLRTLHLQGQRVNISTGTALQGYDVWLAIDYRNFPVKFRGPTSKGEVLEYSVKSLSFEGQTVLGKNIKPEFEVNEPTTLPPELLEQKQPTISVGDDAP